MITPVTYYGGKSRLAPWIVSHFAPHTMYVEPFGGAASVLLCKRPAPIEIYNDAYGDVVNFFRVLRDPVTGARLKELLELTPYAADEYAAAYGSSDDPVESARRFFVRCNMGYGSRGAFENTGMARPSVAPDGRYRDRPNEMLRKVASLPAVSLRLRSVFTDNRDAVEVIAEYDSPTTLIYCDPPYVMSSRADTSDNYKHEYTDADHARLTETLSACRGMVALSGYDTPLHDDLQRQGWHCVRTGNQDQQRAAKVESLWLNPALTAAQHQPSIFAGGLHA